MSSTANDDHNLLSKKWSGGPPGEGMRKAHKWKHDDDDDDRGSAFSDSDSDICGLIKPKKGTNPITTESSVLDELVKDLEEGETSGPDVNPKLASIVNKRFRAPLSLDKLKQKQEKYSRPSNCESLDVPQLNKEVKDMIRTRTVTCGKQFQYIQMAIVKASSALTTTADKLLDQSYKVDNEALLTTIIDALALLGHAHSHLGYRRRDAVLPDLNKNYEGLISSDIPFTKNLLGMKS